MDKNKKNIDSRMQREKKVNEHNNDEKIKKN